MQAKTIWFWVIMLQITIVLTGCKTTGGEGTEGPDVVDSTQTEGDGATTYGTDAGTGVSGSGIDGQGGSSTSGASLDEATFYFDYDQSVVKPESRAALSIHAQYLVNNGNAKILLEGHTDENGTREYNLALGERRSNSVRSYLLVQGVSPQQINTVSYGEEKPVNFGHSEGSWWKNRRVELVYQRR